MQRVECTQCEKTFTKGNIKSAAQALLMHVGRVHTRKINKSHRGVIRRDVSENNGHEAHEAHDPAPTNGHTPKMKPHRASKLSRDERDSVISFIRQHHSGYPSKTACFREAMKAAGATGKIKENSVAVDRHFKLALAKPAEKPARKPKRQFYRGDLVDKVLAHHATPAAEKCDCPNCHYDFRMLKPSKVPNRYCPGCGTTLQNLINQLLSLLAS
jgi:hypothetical protein